MRRSPMHILAALLLLAAAPGWAQITYTTASPPDTGYLPLDGATVKGSIHVRLNAPCGTGPWTYASDGVTANSEGGCPWDFLGATTMFDTRTAPDGLHTVTATSAASPPFSATFTLANGVPVPPIPVPTPGVGHADVAWEAPTLNTDGTALTDLAGYRLSYGATAGALTQTVQLATPSLTTYTVDNLAVGTWYFAVKAYNAATVESELSNVTSKTVTGAAPLPATVTLSANPSSIAAGANSTLTWGSANAQTCTGVGTTLNGSLVVSPAATTTYTESCTGATGAVSASATLTVTPAVPPPTCPAKPADAMRLAICPAGTTGNFPQTRGWVAAAAPICWTAAPAYLPLTPPAGYCPPVAVAWKVAASSALPVYEAVLPAAGATLVRGAQVGTIAAAKPCGMQVFADAAGGSYRTVTASDVQLTSPTYASRALVAVCVAQ